jgi:hypothetical protein
MIFEHFIILNNTILKHNNDNDNNKNNNRIIASELINVDKNSSPLLRQ